MIAVGVDTHKDRHVAVALDRLGKLVGEIVIEASAAGYRELEDWTGCLAEGRQVAFGIEGAGSWGAGLCEHLQMAGWRVVEVERPRRSDRRSGKSDRIDALAAARRALAGDGISTPRGRGVLSSLRVLLIARNSAVAERTRLLNQIQALHTTAPVALRERIGEGTGGQLERRLATMRCRKDAPAAEQTVLMVMRDLAGRSRALHTDANRYRQQLAELIGSLDCTLLDEVGVGPISAAKLLVCDPARFKNEAAFARCNGTAPVPASSGKTIRHRLSRGGDRQVNAAIHTIAITRARVHPQSKAYIDRRTSEGKTKREAMRALKRHISRHLYNTLVDIPLTT